MSGDKDIRRAIGADERLPGLDALRGVAAIVVMLHHIVPMTTGVDLIARGYLSVDFFFMLSGFVVALAYDDTLRAGLPISRFAWRRFVRLYPVIAVGIAAGAVAALLHGTSLGALAIRLATEALFIPTLDGPRGIYRLDGVQWSLLFEFVANIAYAALLWRLPGRWLIAFTLASFAVLFAAAIHYGSIGIGDRGSNMAGGLPRVMFSYALGLLLYRAYRGGRLYVPRSRSALVLVALPALFMILHPIEAHLGAWWIEPLVVAVALPAILLGGIGLELGAGGERVARFVGALSFPLYALHLPAAGAVLAFQELCGSLPAIMALGATIALAVTGSVLLMRHLERRPRRKPQAAPLIAAVET